MSVYKLLVIITGILLICIGIKRYTAHLLRDIDGFSGVTSRKRLENAKEHGEDREKI